MWSTKATLSSPAGAGVDSDPGNRQVLSSLGRTKPSRIRGVSIVLVQVDLVQLALFVFELSVSSSVAARFPVVFFPMVVAVLARNNGAWALRKAGGTGVARKEKA